MGLFGGSIEPICLSLTPGFSPVIPAVDGALAVSTAYRTSEKLLKQLSAPALEITGLKPGVNETGVGS